MDVTRRPPGPAAGETPPRHPDPGPSVSSADGTPPDSPSSACDTPQLPASPPHSIRISSRWHPTGGPQQLTPHRESPAGETSSPRSAALWVPAQPDPLPQPCAQDPPSHLKLNTSFPLPWHPPIPSPLLPLGPGTSPSLELFTLALGPLAVPTGCQPPPPRTPHPVVGAQTPFQNSALGALWQHPHSKPSVTLLSPTKHPSPWAGRGPHE